MLRKSWQKGENDLFLLELNLGFHDKAFRPQKNGAAMKSGKFLKCIYILLIIILNNNVFAGEVVNPQDVCDYLKSENFRGPLQYEETKQAGQFRCSSLRKNIIRGSSPRASDVRYMVTGSAEEVGEISLTLRMRSFKVTVPVLREFEKYVGVIFEKRFGEALPEEISSAIISATRGEWSRQGYQVRLERKHDKATTYDLVFTIAQ